MGYLLVTQKSESSQLFYYIKFHCLQRKYGRNLSNHTEQLLEKVLFGEKLYLPKGLDILELSTALLCNFVCREEPPTMPLLRWLADYVYGEEKQRHWNLISKSNGGQSLTQFWARLLAVKQLEYKGQFHWWSWGHFLKKTFSVYQILSSGLGKKMELLSVILLTIWELLQKKVTLHFSFWRGV